MNTDLVYISDSNIKDAGKGVFSKKFIRSGKKLGEYIGDYYKINNDLEEIYETIYKKSGTDQYVMGISGKNGSVYALIDGKNNGNWISLINGAKTIDQFKYINCEFYQYKKRMYIKSKKDIQKNEELIIDYGSGYRWD